MPHVVVVVVDDDAQCRELLCRLVTQSGAWVIPFVDGHDALRFLQQHPADVVVTDLRMPRFDGAALCTAIRRDPALRASQFCWFRATAV